MTTFAQKKNNAAANGNGRKQLEADGSGWKWRIAALSGWKRMEVAKDTGIISASVEAVGSR